MKDFLFNSGSMELQKLNTRMPGYKLEHVSRSGFTGMIAGVPGLQQLAKSLIRSP